MNRPRPSVLAQFDPLLSEDEIDHVSDSEDESDPNKENLVPELNELSMTAFFSRTYKREYAQPAALTKRLVDIGDATLADAVDEEGEEEEEADTNGAFFSLETPKRSDTVPPLPQSTPRTPLAEITLEHKSRLTPLYKRAVAQRSPTRPSRDAVSSLASLVDSVNLAGTSFGNTARPVSPPRIMVDQSDIENDILATPAPFNLQTSTSSLQGAPEASKVSLLTRPSPAAPPTSKDSNRLSLDLHSSFNLQLQSETSFDLLNDRISFFDAQGRAMSSFLNALDDESDKDSSEHDTPTNFLPTSCDHDDTTPTQETKVTRNAQYERRSSSASPSTHSEEKSPSPEGSPSSQTPSLVFGPLLKQPNSMVTPAVHRTAASTVPALRIIKRVKRYDDKRPSSNSSASSTNTVNNASDGKIPSPPPPPITGVSSEVHASRPSSKTSFTEEGLARMVVTENPMHAAAKTMSKPPHPKIGVVSGSSGPRRILLPESTKPSKPISRPTFARPKVPVPTVNTVNVKGASAAASGVARPTGARGNLPPTSKLPAPSGIARFGRKASAPAVAESSSRIAPVRGIPRRHATYGS